MPKAPSFYCPSVGATMGKVSLFERVSGDLRVSVSSRLCCLGNLVRMRTGHVARKGSSRVRPDLSY